MKKTLALAALAALPFLLPASGNFFRVTPYVQRPATNAMTLVWFMQDACPGKASCWEADAERPKPVSVATKPRFSPELSYHPAQTNYPAPYLPFTIPFRHRARFEGLKPGTRYLYKVECGGQTYTNSFRTAPPRDTPIRFICYSDCETEPESDGAKVAWEDPRDDAAKRVYLVDQTVGYASNVVQMARRAPDLICISGDLAQQGSKQVDWDEFWRHNAGAYNDIAGTVPILAAPGNHDYAGYWNDAGESGMRKYLTYFEFEPNGAQVDYDQRQRFHRLDYGPATFLFLDLNNGRDDDPAKDTNLYLKEADCRAPDFNEGSPQWRWLEEQLADARRRSRFSFVFSHQCPYSVGYHGRLNGDAGLERYKEELSGAPSRCLVPLLMRYGVTAWICGHDEIMERSEVRGRRVGRDGRERDHRLLVYDVGFSGDGLRGRARTSAPNPFEAFRVHTDCPEVWKDGFLVDGGKHYGHLEVNVSTNAQGRWEAVFTPAYVFVTTNAAGEAVGFDRRVYPDVVRVEEEP